eukprot:GEMP01126946.1.p1 GENE.GEMP01126946.1~~GEMP01126946.1.p1  ORF type:complete len:103 (-),score=11.22 GEMP01126946.1:128-436(-)
MVSSVHGSHPRTMDSPDAVPNKNISQLTFKMADFWCGFGTRSSPFSPLKWHFFLRTYTPRHLPFLFVSMRVGDDLPEKIDSELPICCRCSIYWHALQKTRKK